MKKPMIYRIQGLALLLVAILWANGAHAQLDDYRFWTTNKGQRSSTRLQLVESSDDGVRLRREDNNKVITMTWASLSRADQRYAKAQARKAMAPGSAARKATAIDGWPQWRGPNRDGKSASEGLLEQWPRDGPQLLWNVTGLGRGYSTPAVVGDRVYVMGARGGEEFLFAFAADDGRHIWESRVGAVSDGGGFKGPKGTPTIDGERIFAIGSDGTLVCAERKDGATVWRKNLMSDFGGKHGSWHYAESPLIDNDKLICTPGGGASTIVALKKATGAPIWNSPIGRVVDDGFARAGYSSAIVATIAGVRQYINFLHGGVVAVSAESGEPLWHYDSPANGTANCSTPIVWGNSVFAASGYGTGGGRAQIVRRGRTWGVDEKYFVKKMQSHHGGFVLHEGHIFGTNDSVLLCLDWASGNIKWQDRCVGKGSVSMADGNLYVRGEGGDVALIAATPTGYRERGRFSQPDRSGKNAWAHPVIAGGKLFLRDDDRMLCYLLQ